MIGVQLQGAVLRIELQRDAARNALDLATADALLDALGRAADDASVGAVLLHGRGAGFCAGSDVKEMAAASLERRLADCREEGPTDAPPRAVGPPGGLRGAWICARRRIHAGDRLRRGG